MERPFRYIRQTFSRSIARNLDDLNAQLAGVARQRRQRVHATTRRVVAEAFTEEQPKLQELPSLPFGSVLKLERRVSHEGMVSVGGNLYSVPDATRKRLVEARWRTRSASSRTTRSSPRIRCSTGAAGDGSPSATGSSAVVVANATITADATPIPARAGERVGRRSLAVYAAVGRRLAGKGERGMTAAPGTPRPSRSDPPHPGRP